MRGLAWLWTQPLTPTQIVGVVLLVAALVASIATAVFGVKDQR